MSDKKYNSIFGSDKKISAPQYIAELICKKSADIQRIRLPNLFWKDKEKWGDWSRRYHTEIVGANKLLKLYSPEAIISSLKNNKAQRIQSLHNKKLPEIIQEEQRKIDSRKVVHKEMEVNTEVDKKPTKVQTKNRSFISKLRD